MLIIGRFPPRLPSHAIAARAANRKSPYFSGINVAAWASVEVTLLFLMMIALQPDHSRWAVDLPYAQNYAPEVAAQREDALYVGVARNGQVFFRQTRVVPDELPGLIRTALRAGSEKKVYIYADARARNADVSIVINQIRLAGIERVAFVVEKSRVAQP
jgi:biopolymer transport protein ExbD